MHVTANGPTPVPLQAFGKFKFLGKKKWTGHLNAGYANVCTGVCVYIYIYIYVYMYI